MGPLKISKNSLISLISRFDSNMTFISKFWKKSIKVSNCLFKSIVFSWMYRLSTLKLVMPLLHIWYYLWSHFSDSKFLENLHILYNFVEKNTIFALSVRLSCTCNIAVKLCIMYVKFHLQWIQCPQNCEKNVSILASTNLYNMHSKNV